MNAVRYEIRDAISNAGASPRVGSWSDAYHDDIDLAAKTDEAAVSEAAALQERDDERFLEIHPGVDRFEWWGNAPSYVENLFKVVAAGDEEREYKYSSGEWIEV